MPVILNLKRCDNVKECGAPSKCPTGAFFWNEEKNSLDVNVEKCINCHLCENCCPTGAISVFDDEEEYKSALKLIEKDESTIEELFIDRYGAMTVQTTNCIETSDIEELIRTSKEIIALEIVDANNPLCLISAVPYNYLFENKKIKLYKLMTANEDLIHACDILKVKEVPSLLLISNGKIIAKFEGLVEFGSPKVKTLKDFINRYL